MGFNSGFKGLNEKRLVLSIPEVDTGSYAKERS